jgi:N-acetylneuraminic acid mutarotase
LLGAALFALALVILPLLPKEKDKPAIPVIYEEAPAASSSTSSRWHGRAPMTNSRAGLAVVAFNQQLFAIGGAREYNRASRFVEIYDPATDTWTEGDSKPTATSDVAGALLNEKIYVPGGCTDQGKAIDILEIYDPKNDAWTEGPALPEPRCGYSLVAFQEKLYLFGGWNGHAFEDTVFTFLPGSGKWEILEQSMPRPLGYTGAAALNGAIYIVGGYNGQEEFDTTYAFTPATGEWQEKAPLNENRGGLGLVNSNTNLYAIGGGWDRALSSNEKYDPETDTWTPFETPATGPWRNPGLAVVDTTLYAVGGWDGAANEFTDRVVSYQFLFQFFLPVSINQDEPVNE